jgi:hypothetical protein
MTRSGLALLCASGLLFAMVLSGCPSTPDNGDAPPPAEGPSGFAADGGADAASVSHASLRDVEKRAEQALGGAAGPGGTPDFAALGAAAAELEAGVEAVRQDRPAAAGLSYDGLVDEMAESAAALRLASEQQNAFGARRAFHQLTGSCVRCHVGQ